MLRRGFTLVEMSAVIVVLAAAAAVVVPNVVSMQRASERREGLIAIQRLAVRAHEDAIAFGQIRELTFQDGSRRLTLSQVTPPQDPGLTVGRAEPLPLVPDDTQLEPIASVALPEGIEAQQFVMEGQPTNAATWRIRFYPDGRTDGGGMSVLEGDTERSLSIYPDGRIEFAEGRPPDLNLARWPAGNLEIREQTTTPAGGTTP